MLYDDNHQNCGCFLGQLGASNALPEDHGQQTRRRIVENASYGLCQNGADGLSVVDLMKLACALPALAADIGRSGAEARRTFAVRLEKMIDIIAGLIPKRSPSDARQAAAGAIATMVGSIVLARAAGDKRLSDALLEAGRQAVRDQTGSATAEASPAD